MKLPSFASPTRFRESSSVFEDFGAAGRPGASRPFLNAAGRSRKWRSHDLHFLEEIAGWIGAEPAVLASTVNEYNAFCEQRRDKFFAKESAHLVPVSTPPYYAMRCRPVFLTTIGGIKINHRMEALDDRDEPIAGLYAAGNDTGGWEPATYNAMLSGSTFGFALNSGRIAGEYAVSFLSADRRLRRKEGL